MEYVDLTHTFKVGMPVHPGDPQPTLKQFNTIEEHGYSDFEVRTGMHVGTHMDGPAHMIAGGRKLYEIPPEKFFGKGFLVDARNKNIGPELLEGVRAGDIVLVFTGWANKFGQVGYYKDYPVLTEEFAQKLIELKVNAVGVDTSSPDAPPYNIHKILLVKEILIIENLTNLEKLLNQQFEVIALPMKLDADSALVRVVAKIN
ncbi:MAG: cyclase family protein [Candidatus Doudnabacteria bacterium]|nr:cyclase family protein [Candidatus Doudnabacteria bacterium]